MSPKQTILGVILAAVVILIGMSAFSVDERKQALVLQFGKPKDYKKGQAYTLKCLGKLFNSLINVCW